jgi:hypothetical protein
MTMAEAAATRMSAAMMTEPSAVAAMTTGPAAVVMKTVSATATVAELVGAVFWRGFRSSRGRGPGEG